MEIIPRIQGQQPTPSRSIPSETNPTPEIPLRNVSTNSWAKNLTDLGLFHLASLPLERIYILLTCTATCMTLYITAMQMNTNASLSLIESFIAQVQISRLRILILMHGYLMTVYQFFLWTVGSFLVAIRPAEFQQAKEAVIYFFLMRCLLLASTLGTSQTHRQLISILLWLSSISFLRGLVSICKSRFEYLLARPVPNETDLYRVSWCLIITMITNIAAVLIWTKYVNLSGLVFHFAFFEASLLMLQASQLGVKVLFHIVDIGCTLQVDNSEEKLKSCSTLGYRIFWPPMQCRTITFECANFIFGSERSEFYMLTVQLALSAGYLFQLIIYYLYILSADQFRVSFVDFSLILNVKNATMEVLEKCKQISVYRRVVMEMDEDFPNATKEELAAIAEDVCVICLKPMIIEAKKLQCGHLFHRFCLRQCLQKASPGDTYTNTDRITQSYHPNFVSSMRCPLCRQNIQRVKAECDPATSEPALEIQPRADNQQVANREIADPVAPIPPAEEIIRFSTERIARYIPFPALSFEILRHRDPLESPLAMEQMTQQVLEMFPQYSAEQIGRDLIRSRSAARTIENILSGRIQNGPGPIRGEDSVFSDLRANLMELWRSAVHPDNANT